MPRRWPGAGTACTWWTRCRCTWSRHARPPAAIPPSGFTAAEGDARELAERAGSQDAVLLFGPLYHLTEAAQRRQALAEARRVLRPGGRLLAMAVSRFASLLDGLYEDWLDDPDFRPIVDQDLIDGQHRNPDPVGRPEFFTTAYFHTPDGLASEIEQAGFTGTAIYGVEGPGWPLRQEWADPRRREQILFAARSAETQPSLIGFSHPPHRRRGQAVTDPTRNARHAACARISADGRDV